MRLNAAQLRTAYNAQSLIDAGNSGQGQTIAILAAGGFATENITSFDNANNLPDAAVTVSTPVDDAHVPPIPYGWVGSAGNGPSHDEGEGEAELDIEAVHAIAPGAGIHVYEVSDRFDAYVSWILGLASFLQGVHRDGERVASISYSTCESQISPGDLDVLSRLFQQLAERDHVSVFTSSGDSGKDCLQVPNTIASGVSYPASDPWVTSVGGTYLILNPDNTINFEQAWDDDPNSASEGGISRFLPRQSWQVGLGPVSSGTTRLVPDVAADADSRSGLEVWVYLGRGINGSAPGGGTSLATPLWAGVGALFDQWATRVGAPLLGLAARVLYPLARLPDRPLFDVTAGQDTTADLAGPPTQGWDLATGLGSPNAAAIVHDGMAVSPPPAAPPQATKVETFEPWYVNTATGLGQPAPGATIVRAAGICDAGSPDDPGRSAAYSCHVTQAADPNIVLGPCFANHGSGNPGSPLLCVLDPTSVNQVLLTQAAGSQVPPTANQEIPNALPWFLVLADGKKCHLSGTGTNTALLPYDCGSASTASIPDRSRPLWTVQEGT